MAYNPNDAVLLKHLMSLGTRIKGVTDGLDTRVAALEEAGAEANVLEGVKVNGVALAIAEKMVDILITTGTANGTIKVNNVDVSVAGLAALAYKAEVSQADLSSALAAVIAAKAEDSDLQTIGGKVDVLIGSVQGDGSKSARAIAAEEVAKVVANADTDFDTLKEIADWITNDTTGAAKMANDISALKTKLTLGTHEVEGSQVEYATVKAYVEAVVSGFISLTALSVSTSGTGNVVTGLAYDNTTGTFTATKGMMVEPVTPATANSIALLTAAGQLADSGVGIATDTAVTEAIDAIFAAA